MLRCLMEIYIALLKEENVLILSDVMFLCGSESINLAANTVSPHITFWKAVSELFSLSASIYLTLLSKSFF